MPKMKLAVVVATIAFTFGVASPAFADTIEIDPATGEQVVTDVEPDNAVTFCGFEEGDISDEELAEMGIDDTWTITYMTQEECDAETAAAEADAEANPDPEGPDPTLTEPPEPTDEPTADDEVSYPVPDDGATGSIGDEVPIEDVTEILDASVTYPNAADRAEFFGADAF